MKKAQKNVLGAFGLVLVAATTIFAAFLPSPEASAIVTRETSDTLTLRVVGATPNVDVTGITSGSTVVTPKHDLNIAYENISNLKVKLKYTDKNGVTHTHDLINESISDDSGNRGMSFDFSTGKYTYNGVEYSLPDFGYGKYVLTVSGEGFDGATDEQNISFTYRPIKGDVVKDDTTGEIYVDLDYDTEGGSSTSGEIESITINVYDEDGNLVKPLSPITVIPPVDKVVIPFDEYDLPSGKYTIEIIAYDGNGNEIYKAYTTHYTYKSGEDDKKDDDDDIVVPSTGAPDTGGLFGNLNISKADYLITGLIIFSIVGIGGAVYITRHHKKSSKN